MEQIYFFRITASLSYRNKRDKAVHEYLKTINHSLVKEQDAMDFLYHLKKHLKSQNDLHKKCKPMKLEAVAFKPGQGCSLSYDRGVISATLTESIGFFEPKKSKENG